jgi:signal transduction histidine kinase/CheY-like chemotaxis protein
MNNNLLKSTVNQLDSIAKDVNSYLDRPHLAFNQVSMTLNTIIQDSKIVANAGVVDNAANADTRGGQEVNRGANAQGANTGSDAADNTGDNSPLHPYEPYIRSVDTYLTNNQLGLLGVNRVYAYIDDQLIHSDRVNIPATYMIKNSTWYQHGLRNITSKYTTPYRDLVTDKMIISLCQKITDVNGATHGVLALDLDLEWINTYIKGLFANTDSYGVVLSENNLVISHPLEEKRFLFYENIGFRSDDLQSLFKYNSSFSQSIRPNVYGVMSKVFLYKMPNNWTVIVITPTFTYYKGVYITLGIFLACVLSLMIFVCSLFLRLGVAKARLEKESLDKTTFLNRISHEIRTPMNAIIGMTELLSRTSEKLPHRAKVYCNNIKLASGNLVSIINDILDFSNIDYASVNLLNDKYTISSLIYDTINISKARIIDDNVILVVNLDPKLPNNIFGDVLKVRQCLLNMLFTSIKYLKEGSVCLEVTGEMEGINLILTVVVKDNGPGLSRQALDKLLDDSFQSHSRSADGKEPQSGLGLAKRLSEIMDGHIEVFSSHGHGNVFTLTLPQVVASDEPIARVNDLENIRLLAFEEKLPVARSMSMNLATLGVKHELVSTIDRFEAKLQVESWTHLILPSGVYPDLEETIAEQAPDARVGLTIKESQPLGLKKVNFLQTPVHSQSLANFLNNYSFSYSDRYLSNIPGTVVKMPGARVLVVDDLETNLMVAEGLMEDYGLTIDLCRGGLEAVDLVKSNEYDLVFMDHMMPGLDGIETTRIIRTMESRRYTNLPIIALTANAMHGAKEMFLDHGLNDFIPKPIDSARLEEVLLTWIPKDKQVVSKHQSPLDIDGKDELDGEAGAGAGSEAGPATGAESGQRKGPAGSGSGPVPGYKVDPAKGGLGELDTITGLTLSGGKDNIYQKILKVFLIDAEKAKSILESAINQGDLKEYTIHIHALKGATATIGARNLSELAKELESAGRHDNLDLVKTNTPIFLESLMIVAGKVNQYLAKHNGSIKPGRELSGLELLEELKKLCKAFEDVDTKTIGLTLNNLKTSAIATSLGPNLPTDLASGLEKITDCFFDVEYDQAVSVINSLMAYLTTQLSLDPDQAKKLLN